MTVCWCLVVCPTLWSPDHHLVFCQQALIRLFYALFWCYASARRRARNQLSALPACLSLLPLRVLNASNNKLVSLPDTIAQLHHLMELDVSCNELSALPRHIGRLKALRE
ncbi:hypothetical protein CRUP_023099, partial [Coryphaenoides rupestris]